ncbi:nucleotide sugar dehydrogenase [Hoeflea phototrophica DFL-43]|jgi:UDPglucose 6-dehydrogenase|uniref:UDP-glucose 6-dehydrogenase n=1 Tax=Hoeflea phototrophica (strain DSM 17068 / NCIMB 14078 / DFL-43) TaxID=411684 RepID=A9CZX7_HOEPD|nr:UDP-glucose/GDP-mannose dehydrogenase family protein [Hoeflea phototrophica]EDQ34872.1 nucleotide sugar dehydrogenase [Hoeflea phototrophica DFL-43]
MQIAIFGTGYVGLVLAATMSDVGQDVTCVDVDVEKIAGLKRGEVPIYEPGLEALVRDNQAAGRLTFTTDPAVGVASASIIFIAVGTPPEEDGSADLRHVLSVGEMVGTLMQEPKIIINKSTVPVGTADRVKATVTARLAERGLTGLEFDVVSNPEFLKEGAAVADCMKPDRIILGVETAGGRSEQLLRELYGPFNRNHDKILVMDVRSAELTKYAANCMLAAKISFMNEMAHLADKIGADIEKVRLGIGSDPRIGYHFIYPGVGYGGSCFPKDVRALISTAREHGIDPMVMEAVNNRNNHQKTLLFDKIRARFGSDLRGRTFALWGLSFKPNTDDIREAPSRTLMEALWAAGAHVRAYDPKAMKACQEAYGDRPDLFLAQSQEQALEGADALVLVTEWKSFRSPDMAEIAAKLKQPVIFDGRNIFDPAMAAGYGLEIVGIGRSSRMQPETL